MSPVIDHVSAVNNLQVLEFCIFNSITIIDSSGDSGHGKIISLGIYDTTPAELEGRIFPQGQDGSMITMPDFQIVPDFQIGIMPALQSSCFSGTQIAVINGGHDGDSPLSFNNPFNKLLPVMYLEVMLPEERPVSIQEIPEIAVTVLIGFP